MEEMDRQHSDRNYRRRMQPILCAAMDSKRPEILDSENQVLTAKVTGLFETLLLTGNVSMARAPISISGAMQSAGLAIRSVATLWRRSFPAASTIRN